MVSRLLLKIILPTLLIGVWLNLCYYGCCKNGELDRFLFWIVAGCPFGIRKLGCYFYPVGFDFSGGIAILALNLILGGLVGGFVLVYNLINILIELVNFVFGDILKLRKS